MASYNTKLSNILYHWQLSMASFRFCETYLLHIKPFVVNKSAISPFLSGLKVLLTEFEFLFSFLFSIFPPTTETRGSGVDTLSVDTHSSEVSTQNSHVSDCRYVPSSGNG